MKRVWQILLTCCLVLAGMFVMASPSFADQCYRIDAKGNGTINGDGTTSARITGGGLLNGTTQGSFSAAARSLEKLFSRLTASKRFDSPLTVRSPAMHSTRQAS
jgi:hypothetical protein